MKMEYIIKDKFIKEKHKVKENYIINIKIIFMRVNGVKTFLMDKGINNGIILNFHIKVDSSKELNKALVYINKKINLNMKVILKIMK